MLDTSSSIFNRFALLDENEFDKYSLTVIRNGEAVTVYSGKNISLTIDKDTFEVKEYIYCSGIFEGEVYDLNTGYLIVEKSVLETYASKSNYEFILYNNYVVDFVNISNYVEDHKLQ